MTKPSAPRTSREIIAAMADALRVDPSPVPPPWQGETPMTEQPPQTPAETMAKLADALALIGSVVGRYRAGLVDNGIPADVADEMARELNTRLMDGAFATATPSKRTPDAQS